MSAHARTRPALRVPEVVQTSSMDCGPASLKAILEGFGIPVGYGQLRAACQTDVDGTSIDTIEELSIQLGLDAEQIMIPVDHALEGEADALPALAVVRLPTGFTHFVVVWRRHGPFVQVMDPAGGRRWTTVRFLRDQLYSHTMPVPADAFREYAAGDEFLPVLRRRMARLGLSRRVVDERVAGALADRTWVGIATLDAAVRLVAALVDGGGVSRGKEAAALIARFGARALSDPATIPHEYWTARRADDDAEVLLTGAVLLRVRGARAVAGDEGTALPPDVVAALREPPTRTGARLWSMLRQDGILTPAFVAVATAASALGVLAEGLVFRGVIELSSTLRLVEQRAIVGASVVGLLVLLLVIRIPIEAATLRMGRRLEARLRLALLQKIPRLTDRYFHSRLTSDMAQRAHSVHSLRRLPGLGARLLSSALALAATATGVIFLDPASALTVVAVAILAVVIPLSLQPLLNERDLRTQTLFGSLTRFYLDALLGLVPLRTHGGEQAMRREHEGTLVEWERSSLGLLRVVVIARVVTASAGIALTGWLLFGYLAGGGSLAGALLLVYWALRIPALGQEVAQTAHQYPHVRNVALRLLEPLSAPEEPVVEADGAAPQGPVGIELDAVTVRAGGHTILDGVDLSIAPGEHVAVVGASGAGKSTLVGLLLGFHRPGAGEVRVDGDRLTAAKLAWLRRQTAWIDPSVQLWNRSVLRNLRYGNEDRRASIPRVLDDAELYGVLESLPEGVSTVLGEAGGLASGGEGQRVRVGRALLRRDARLVVLDEAFRGLDRGTRRRMLGRTLERFADATVVCVTHDVAETATFDRVLVVEGGRVVEDGPPDELAECDGSAYRRLLAADRTMHDRLWNTGFRRVRLSNGTLDEAEGRIEARP